MERTYYALNLDLEMHWHCEDNDHIWASYLSESFVMRCFGIVRTIPTSSSSWPMDHTLDLMVCILSFLRWLWLSLWGRHCFDTTLIYIVDWLLQWSKDFSDTTVFGWPTLTMSNRTFYSPLRLETVRWYISMWKTDLEKELCVLTIFCIQKKVVQIPCVNHFVLEKLVSLWLMSWLFTFGWEPVWFENFWKCFDVFEFI